MPNITKQQFIQRLTGRQLNVQQGKNNPALEGVNLETADLNNDGLINGEEIGALFTAVDAIDKNGDANSIASGNTPSGRAYSELQRIMGNVPPPKSDAPWYKPISNTWNRVFGPNEPKLDNPPDIKLPNGFTHAPSLPTVNNGNGVIKKGMGGPGVWQVQQRLVDKGLLPEATGLFNQATKDAVKEYQQNSDLGVDGAVGPATIKSLFSDRPDLLASQPRERITFNNPGRPIIASEHPTLEKLKEEIDITYGNGRVTVGHSKKKLKDRNTLRSSLIGEAELKKAHEASEKWNHVRKALFGLSHPRLAINQTALERSEKLSFVKKNNSGSALGRISNAMFDNIQNKPSVKPYEGPGGEKLTSHDATKNMMLHVFGQSTFTVLYGEGAADLTGDLHERDQPSLITGEIGEDEEAQAIDNYADMVNNEYGQEVGLHLRRRLGINDRTVWTPDITAKYLNSVQDYFSQSHEWSFKDFDASDARVHRFTNLLNEVQHGT